MLIISKTHDYYDVVANSVGHDTSMRYIRTSKVISTDDSYTHSWTGLGPEHHNANGDTVYIGFCGKVYYCLKVNVADRYESPRYKFIYNQEDYDIQFPKKDIKLRRYKWVKYRPKDVITNWVVDSNHLFLEHHVPIWAMYPEYGTNRWGRSANLIKTEINANLNQFEFFRVFDPFSAYQEITMFLGGMASPEKEIPHIDDKTMAEVKGFNKFSFRKDKSKKK